MDFEREVSVREGVEVPWMMDGPPPRQLPRLRSGVFESIVLEAPSGSSFALWPGRNHGLICCLASHLIHHSGDTSIPVCISLTCSGMRQ
ncbi:hypothetical protein CDAR_399641 [Caerostris darwini]|uniref:Uncharacterized protein n=1 Tax=Caerostris darwini TaxID=1538125 RepID=A0AAV4RMW8_9ARAC|nr:hypothetical protein CDAR_399641 [Caerostris darwini]